MADRHVLADDRLVVLGDVEHRIILHVGARADPNRAVVAADHRAEPDAGFLPNHHVADQDRGGRDEGRVVDLRGLALVFDDHARSSANSRTVPLLTHPPGPS